jgi:hypothetical protein
MKCERRNMKRLDDRLVLTALARQHVRCKKGPETEDGLVLTALARQ